MRDITHYFIHTIILIRGQTGMSGIGTDQYGDPLASATPAAGLALNARVEWDNQLVRTEGGEEVVCSGMVYLADRYPDPITGVMTALDIGSEDRIEFEGREHKIALRTRAEGWNFTTDQGSHWEIWIV